jgi:hypothetical protein
MGRAIMGIITSGENLLKNATEFHYRAIENCLRIVNILLEKQQQFIELSRKSKSPVGNLYPFQSNRQLYVYIYINFMRYIH